MNKRSENALTVAFGIQASEDQDSMTASEHGQS
jgi:hypothetical protein